MATNDRPTLDQGMLAQRPDWIIEFTLYELELLLNGPSEDLQALISSGNESCDREQPRFSLPEEPPQGPLGLPPSALLRI